ncbi:hypothetical protein [Bacillus atrophaeus]|uniref:hypothetical protein n=1 Tax=Bacillus atrophaeus TaxID=1452 RepID=UPI00227E57A9|nr:hypothetical protein [Bacillus atrophaeus]MCY8977801.1 hypothetical protein [Bacillus atrophaeus]WNV80277.1 hypothetical protein RUL31_02775 [Bacillus atrophaeus]
MNSFNLLNRAYLESELEKVGLLQLAEEFIERLKELVPCYEKGQRILLESESPLKDDIKRFVSAVFSFLKVKVKKQRKLILSLKF